ncbi:hypothetical protein BASA50_001806 [Batrachochytrium salamandrivorans]|uniref:tRNA-dihydrouridine synthase n=1 Tax=Batrachochytrium salamandrivorans TaxID=1357716 RepID=A0ABQ8FN63_9FUNG|nr:hypothetical protein BASA50_001806 [Batrachochytrium salamandrivorans]
MVRVSTLPFRLLAIRYGADIVYSPEIVDRRLMRSKRIENTILGTIDYVDDSGSINLRIRPEERGKLVVQLGSSNPVFAVLAAQKVAADVDGIDLNCGCPKKFSVVGGMGSALLDNQDTLVAILEALVSVLSIPVTCKIRLLNPKDGESSIERTVKLMQRLEKTKIDAIAVHCRFVHERPRQPAHWDVYDTLAKSVSIPVIANGDIWTMSDVHRLKETTGSGVSSFMIARGAQDNVSTFCKDGPAPIWDVLKNYLHISQECGSSYYSIKYVLLQMWEGPEGSPFRQRLLRCKTTQAMSELFKELDYCQGVISPDGV